MCIKIKRDRIITMDRQPLKSVGFSQGSWVMPTIIHNYQVCTRTVLSGIFCDGFQWRWRVATSAWTSSLYTTETASILRSAFPMFLIIAWRACRMP